MKRSELCKKGLLSVLGGVFLGSIKSTPVRAAVTDNLSENQIEALLKGKVDRLSGDLVDDNSTNHTGTLVEGFSYDEATKEILLKLAGADSVIPFKKSGAELIGTYTTDTSIDVSRFGANDVSQFLAVSGSIAVSSSVYVVSQTIGSPFYMHPSASYTPPSLSLDGNTLTITVAKLNHQAPQYQGWGIYAYSTTNNGETKVYFIG